MKRVCVYCGSSAGNRQSYLKASQALGTALVRRGLGLVYGGSNVGLMGTIADTVLAEGGEVIGVIPAPLVAKEVAHRGLTDLHIVPSMHERKAMMAELADAFIALPGGFGTLEEFCEIVTWVLLGIHQKPCGLFNVEGYYDGLLAFLNHGVTEGFILPEYRPIVLSDSEADGLLEKISSYEAPFLHKWIDRDET
jgi:uncharacterized protein (TIGR00730 family)